MTGTLTLRLAPPVTGPRLSSYSEARRRVTDCLTPSHGPGSEASLSLRPGPGAAGAAGRGRGAGPPAAAALAAGRRCRTVSDCHEHLVEAQPLRQPGLQESSDSDPSPPESDS